MVPPLFATTLSRRIALWLPLRCVPGAGNRVRRELDAQNHVGWMVRREGVENPLEGGSHPAGSGLRTAKVKERSVGDKYPRVMQRSVGVPGARRQPGRSPPTLAGEQMAAVHGSSESQAASQEIADQAAKDSAFCGDSGSRHGVGAV